MFGLDFFDPKTIALNVTNLALGVVTALCFALVGWGVLSEVLERARKRLALAAQADDHSFLAPELGLTMADGGETVKDDSKDESAN